jgi:flagellar hook-associated protein 1
MQAQMTGVAVSGQNLANVNTTGYMRQAVQLATSPDISTSIGPEGTGVEVASIQQTVNTLLNSQIQNQSSTSGYWNGQQSALQSAQDGLDEFLNGTDSTSSSSSAASDSSTGLASQLSGLFNSFSSLATSPTSTAEQQSVISQAQTLATTFNQVDTQLSSLNTSLNTSLTSDVSSANQLLTNIATLNQQISAAQASGGSPNDLLDERQQDLVNLAQLTNINTSTESNGSVDVSIGGQSLVSGYNVADTLQTYDPGNGQLQVETATGGVPLTLTGGTMQGTIDARDGSLASLQSSINTLASTLITQVNSIFSAGYSSTGTTGANFFNGTDASSISVNHTLVSTPSLMQSSDSATASGDNTVALQLAQLGSTPQTALNGQTFNDSYNETVAAMGDSLQTANNEVNSQSSVSQMLQTQFDSVSGVSVDTEMTNLMTYQRAYEASAQLVTTINTMLGDTLAMTTA